MHSNWNDIDTCRQAKRFILPSEIVTRNLLKLDKKNLRVITGLLTGHCPSNYHLGKMGIVHNTLCRFCHLEIENSEHLLCDCVALLRKRNQILGKGLMQPFEILQLSPSRVIDFIRQVEPNWDIVQ